MSLLIHNSPKVKYCDKIGHKVHFKVCLNWPQDVFSLKLCHERQQVIHILSRKPGFLVLHGWVKKWGEGKLQERVNLMWKCRLSRIYPFEKRPFH